MADTENILMPMEQEGSKSVVRAWLKKVGDAVKRDEPIVELETDKVAVEVPSPSDGVLSAISLNEGDEAAPGAVLGVLNTSGAAAGATASRTIDVAPTDRTGAVRADYDAGAEMRLSPLVKRLLSEHRLSPADIEGTGRDGRITHKDVEDRIARGKSKPATAKPAAPAVPASSCSLPLPEAQFRV